MPEHHRIDDLRRRVQQDPASIAFAQLAEEYRRAGQPQESVDVCRAGLAIHPGYLSARVTLGRALIELNQIEQAQAELELVLKSAPENLAAIRGLAEIHHRRGHLAEALAQYRAALNLARNDPDLQQTVSDLSRKVEPRTSPRGSDGLSLEQMQQALSINLQAQPPPIVEPPVAVSAADALPVPAIEGPPVVPSEPTPVAPAPPSSMSGAAPTESVTLEIEPGEPAPSEPAPFDDAPEAAVEAIDQVEELAGESAIDETIEPFSTGDMPLVVEDLPIAASEPAIASSARPLLLLNAAPTALEAGAGEAAPLESSTDEGPDESDEGSEPVSVVGTSSLVEDLPMASSEPTSVAAERPLLLLDAAPPEPAPAEEAAPAPIAETPFSVVDAVYELDLYPAFDVMDALASFEIETTEVNIDTPELNIETPGSKETPESMRMSESMETFESAGTSESIGTIDTLESVAPIEPGEPIEPVEPVESAAFMEPVAPIELIAPVEIVMALEVVESEQIIEPIEIPDPMAAAEPATLETGEPPELVEVIEPVENAEETAARARSLLTIAALEQWLDAIHAAGAERHPQ